MPIDPPQSVRLIDKPVLDLSADRGRRMPNANLLTIMGGFEERQEALAWRWANEYGKDLWAVATQVLLAQAEPALVLKEDLDYVSANNGMVYWLEGNQVLLDHPALAEVVANWIGEIFPDNVLMLAEQAYSPTPGALSQVRAATVELPPLPREEYEQVWKQLGKAELGPTLVSWNAVNNTYLPDYQRTTETLSWTKQEQEGGSTVNTELVKSSYLATSPEKLGNLGERIAHPATYNSVSLLGSTMRQLHQLESAYREQVRFPQLPQGLLCAFIGYAGTQRSESAQALAHALDLPVYRVNCGALVQESVFAEEQLEALFAAAAPTSAALLFEHAELVFSPTKRSSSKLAPLLMQHLAGYYGLVVLISNTRQGLEPARFRPALQVVNFWPLSPEQQADLFARLAWRNGVRIATNVNLVQLFSRYAFNSNNIHHIVDRAILLASTRKPLQQPLVLELQDIVAAIQSELS